MLSNGSRQNKLVEIIQTSSLEETLALGRRIGETVSGDAIICLHGDLGAGKTQLVKGIVSGAALIAPEEVCSPTFVYLAIYHGPKNVYHFDLYRLRDTDEFLSMGFDDYFAADGICCIEWSERITPIIPADALHILLEVSGENSRMIHLDQGVL